MSLIKISDKATFTRTPIYDPDAINYLAGIEAADGQELEYEVKEAIQEFIVGCKDDGIWNAIKSSCIIAGARTLAAAATVPLRGPTPTLVTSPLAFNQSNYNRKTGVNGGSTAPQGIFTNYDYDDDTSVTYLDFHLSVYLTQGLTTPAAGILPIINPTNSNYATGFIQHGPSGYYVIGCTSGGAATNQQPLNTTSILNSETGFFGSTRGTNADPSTATSTTPSTHFAVRGVGTNYDVNVAANSNMGQGNMKIKAFTGGAGFPEAEPRVAFYTVGSSIDLTKLDARVTKLMFKFNLLFS
jgi:hypothetical protein